MTISDVRHNEVLSQDRFELPDEIQALADKQNREVPQGQKNRS